MSRPVVRVRVHLPAREELLAFSASVFGHALLLAAILGLGAGRAPAGPPRKVLSVRLAAVPRTPTTPAARKPGNPPATRAKPKPPPRKKKRRTRRTRPRAPRKVETRPEAGATARPKKLPRQEPPPPEPAPPAEPGSGAEAKAKTGPALPEGPISGGVAGLQTDEPLTADWYVGLVVARLQEAWRDRPVLPAGSPPRRVVVGFTIHRDGRVTDVRVEIPSGYTPLDTSAIRAVASLGRLPPLPRSYGKERLGARFVFELLPPGP